MVIEVAPSPFSLEVKNPLSPARGRTLALQMKMVTSDVLRGSKERVLVYGSCELSKEMVTLGSSLDKCVVPFSHEMSELETATPVSVAGLREMKQVRTTGAS